MIEASAPGKLFVSGEYAVLEGAPAIACAVGRRVRVRLQHSRAGEAQEAACWREAAEELIFARAHDGNSPEGGLEIDSRALYAADGAKYGLGSSAAVAAAVTGALLAARGSPPDIGEQLRLATALHRSRQGCGGSGVDVAASLYGGVLAQTGDRVQRLDWPAGMACAVIWSGHCADTGRALERYRAAVQEGSRRVRAPLQRLKAEAGAVLEAWREGARAALDALERFAAAWQALDSVADLGIYSAAHRELRDLARASGCLYKPSGAGGGDCGLALSCDPRPLERMRRAAAKKGYETLEMDLAVTGMSVTRG